MVEYSINQVLKNIDDNIENSVTRLEKLLSFKSISTDPTYKEDCKDTAKFLVEMLKEIGFEASIRETEGHPMVVAHHNSDRTNAPHVLFYGHYDVQPVDPIEQWQSDPFVATRKIKNGKEVIVARGSSDDKGQLMTFIEACRSYKELYNSLPLRVTILLEGEEESGSPSLIPFLVENKEELKADFALVCDTSMWDENTPSISLGLRGMLAQEIVIKGADRDLHSGSYGGAAANPLNILAKILGNIKSEDGKVQIPGFYDGVFDIDNDLLSSWNNLNCTAEQFLAPVGLSQISGEKDRSLLETIWSRPTADINGIKGGYNGDGFKTVIPGVASAKISFRLVQNQDPEKIKQAFKAFVKERVPSDCQVQIIDYGCSPAISLSSDADFIQKGLKSLTEEWDKEAILVCCGGSIPVVGDFQKILDMKSMLIGFALEDDNIHSPNEKYNIKSFHKGQRSWARLILELAK